MDPRWRACPNPTAAAPWVMRSTPRRLRAKADLVSIPEAAAAWAVRNGCEAEPTEETVADDVNELVFPCPPGAEAELYVVEGGGHTWPGSDFDDSIVDIVGYVTHSISANEIMWAFFQDHPLPDLTRGPAVASGA